MVTLNHDTEPQGEDIGAQDARQGMKTGYMRRVLLISVVLAVVAMLAAWLWIDRPHSMTPDTVPNAAAIPTGPANGQVIPQRDTAPAPGVAPTHVTPQADQPQTQD